MFKKDATKDKIQGRVREMRLKVKFYHFTYGYKSICPPDIIAGIADRMCFRAFTFVVSWVILTLTNKLKIITHSYSFTDVFCVVPRNKFFFP